MLLISQKCCRGIVAYVTAYKIMQPVVQEDAIFEDRYFTILSRISALDTQTPSFPMMTYCRDAR
jgi:hypothetical protein